jgi:hypothetical protein
MTASSVSIISRLREIRSRHPSAEDYGRELARLADVQFGTVSAVDDGWEQDLDKVVDLNRVQALRSRLKALEERVKELEALR